MLSPRIKVILFLFFLFARLSAKDGIMEMTACAPLDEGYREQLDDWGWEKYYVQHWDSLQLVFKEALHRSAACLSTDPVIHRINLLSRLRVGQANCHQGYFYSGIQMMEKALVEAEVHFGPILDWSFYYVALGDNYEAVGNINKAYWAHTQASRIVEDAVLVGDSNYFLRGNKERNMAEIHLAQKRYPEALVYLEQSIDSYKQAGEDGMMRIKGSYGDYAITLAHLGQFEKADSTLHLLESMPVKYRADWYTEWKKARVAFLKGDEATALKAYRQSLLYGRAYIQPTHPFGVYRAKTFLLIRQDFASYLTGTGQLRAADEVLQEALAIGREFGLTNGAEFQQLQLTRAEVLFSGGDYHSALKITEELIGSISSQPAYCWGDLLQLSAGHNSPQLVSALNLQAQCLYELYSQNKSAVSRALILQNCKVGQDVINAILLSHTAEFQHSYLLEENQELFDLPVTLAYEKLLLQKDYSGYDALFQAIEATKNLDISSNIRLRFEERKVGPELRKMIDKELMLSAQSRGLEKRLEQITPNKAKRNEVQELRYDMLKTRRKIDELKKRMEVAYPEYFSLKYQPKKNCTLAEFQSKLEVGEMAFLYRVGTKETTVLAVCTDDVRMHRVANVTLESIMDSFIGSIRTPQEISLYPDQDWQLVSHQLYQTLLGKLMDEKHEINSIVLIPDGILNFLPWSALLTGTNFASLEWSKQKYLIKDYFITREASATSFYLNRSMVRSFAEDLYLGMAPTYNARSKYTHTGFRGIALESTLPKYFRQLGVSLKFNGDEIQSVRNSFDDHLIYLGPAATEDQFKSIAPRARYIHLAAHGIVDADYANYSHVALASGQSNGEDGLLYSDEIYNLSLQAELVVLSACSSGDGQFKNGSGVQSLARAFRAAGCRDVLMSLWPIEDESAFRIVTSFFKNLPDSNNSAKALRAATLHYLDTVKKPSRTHPYYWTAFSLIGTGSSSVNGRTGLSVSYWWIAGVLFVLLTVSLLVRRSPLGLLNWPKFLQ